MARSKKRTNKKKFDPSSSEAFERSNDAFKSEETRNRQKGCNDIEWHTLYPEQMAAVARIPFANRPGMKILGSTMTNLTGQDFHLDMRTPGIMSIKFEYTVGYSDRPDSPASLCAIKFYEPIRAAYSGSIPYQPADLMMYVLGLDQIHAYLAWLKRLYSAVSAYTPENYLFPRELVSAMFPNGLSDAGFSNLVTEKVRLWGIINELCRMVNRFKVPNAIPLFKRHRFMNEHVYADINSVRGQMYVFTPGGYYKVDPIGGNQGTRLVHSPLTFSNAKVVDRLYEYGLDLIQSFLYWEDIFTMNGHIDRAFRDSPEGFYEEELLDQNAQISPVWNEDVLAMIHNLTLVYNYEPVDIDQAVGGPEGDNSIIHKPVGYTMANFANLDLSGENPTANDVIEATRLTTLTRTPGQAAYLITCSEVVTDVAITTPAWDKYGEFDPQNQNIVRYSFASQPNGFVIEAEQAQHFMDDFVDYMVYWRMIAELGYWRKAPRIPAMACIAHGGTPTTARIAWLTGEVDNPTQMSATDLENLHRADLFSLFRAFG